jgi:hypothetical protein
MLKEASEQMRHADQIRELISVLNSKLGDISINKELEQWSIWANQQAEALDPRSKSYSETLKWMQKFKLR